MSKVKADLRWEEGPFPGSEMALSSCVLRLGKRWPALRVSFTKSSVSHHLLNAPQPHTITLGVKITISEPRSCAKPEQKPGERRFGNKMNFHSTKFASQFGARWEMKESY